MNILDKTYGSLLLVIVFVMGGLNLWGQDTISAPIPKAQLRRQFVPAELVDSLGLDSLRQHVLDTLQRRDVMSADIDSVKHAILDGESFIEMADTVRAGMIDLKLPSSGDVAQALRRNFFVPDPKKAMWLAIVFPGGGQIYNRKYWKLPIIYGGFLGCVYALNWNNTMYRDYSQAYIDIMDSDPNTKSYENFIPKGYDIDRNLTRIQDLFRRKKNYYRRYRDLSMFCMIGVYMLSIVDAYVDAELSSFDISRDLSMKVRPSVIHERGDMAMRNPYASQSYGVQCSFSF